jgi:hypothetical protein
MIEPVPDTPAAPGSEKAHAALVARLTQLYRQSVKPPKSLQPTPEAAKSKIPPIAAKTATAYSKIEAGRFSALRFNSAKYSLRRYGHLRFWRPNKRCPGKTNRSEPRGILLWDSERNSCRPIRA